ncbi:DUF4367 domain-containing protein [Alkaliphilus peptidifermentans]|uniref:DUF4367 domain-containing protein n=1 Tax=Alkaliphilus peptidifermentans DSM 18978 TaxID=1120976 RepID=A0A1G5HPC1_9FIRM|nr:DUF4367 domain-containing protein [Alkaliphilus peptidifermentans]SCY64898.1 protein of unknown function [Alkaliphilus peptidifermentans DSM 18978]
MSNITDSFDDIIQKSLIKEIESIQEPDMDYIWKGIRQHIKAEKRKIFIMRNRSVAIIIGILFIIGITFTGLEEGYASYYQRILSIVSKSMGDNLSLQISNQEITSHIMGMEIEPLLYELTLEEAMEQVSFVLKVADYVPEEYNLEKVYHTELNGQTISLEIIYTSLNREPIRVLYEPIVGEYSQAINVNTQYAVVDEVKYDNTRFIIIESNNGYTKILWDRAQVKYLAEGNDREKLFQLVTSIK